MSFAPGLASHGVEVRLVLIAHLSGVRFLIHEIASLGTRRLGLRFAPVQEITGQQVPEGPFLSSVNKMERLLLRAFPWEVPFFGGRWGFDWLVELSFCSSFASLLR